MSSEEKCNVLEEIVEQDEESTMSSEEKCNLVEEIVVQDEESTMSSEEKCNLVEEIVEQDGECVLTVKIASGDECRDANKFKMQKRIFLGPSSSGLKRKANFGTDGGAVSNAARKRVVSSGELTGCSVQRPRASPLSPGLRSDGLNNRNTVPHRASGALGPPLAVENKGTEEGRNTWFRDAPLLYSKLKTWHPDTPAPTLLKIFLDMLEDEYETNTFQTPINRFYRVFLNRQLGGEEYRRIQRYIPKRLRQHPNRRKTT